MRSELMQQGVDARQASRNRGIFFLLLLSFVLPFVFGHMAYFQGWYAGGKTTNKGELLTPPVELAALRLQGVQVAPAGQWSLLYFLPAHCESACRNSLFQMRQVKKATGADTGRVRLVLVQTGAPDTATEQLLHQEFATMVRLQGSADVIDSALAAAVPQASQAGRVYIMDPRGLLMMSYLPQADEKTSIIRAQDILLDLQHLLKVSEIG